MEKYHGGFVSNIIKNKMFGRYSANSFLASISDRAYWMVRKYMLGQEYIGISIILNVIVDSTYGD